ncbi:hypothetical protein BUALT_Bualt13G0089600 [Buddleja alternifolia]|uniref:Uncharacterized protein n=1 Tax=Buddleja alternifolia TaxID=168488 RepID=A0AAV6WLQ0_9LAMI|nr:hypothetical protein BUALT_Bualt13G0089600 [Buddleja alternifolia]
MAVNAYDVQVFLWEILQLCSRTCITLLIEHPFISFSLLCLFLLYMTFSWFFWYLIYSFPLFVCAGLIILRITSSLGNVKKHKDEENDEKSSRKSTTSAADDITVDKSEKSFMRVHSVRRRRAKNITREDSLVEKKNAVSLINFKYDDIVVDKNALIEESPKEIREVEVLNSSLVNNKVKDSNPSASISQSLEHKLFSEARSHRESLRGWKDEEEKQKEGRDDRNKALEEDDEKNVMEDIGISEIERNKRLESLIARRRSRKLLNLQVRRTLMKMDRNDRISSLVIPKLHANNVILQNNNICGGQFSPGPGSAPSILIPMRNPFDIPYDPQEEKPDLTGDSFNQEFDMSSLQNKDMMFCRHESFRLGAFSPNQDLNQDCEKTYDFRYGNQFDREIGQTIEPGPSQVHEPKVSTMDNPHDQIKEIVQVSENGIHNHAEENNDQVKNTRPISQDDLSPKSSSSSSSEEDQQFLKIDREAILKSLSSLARRNSAEERANYDDRIDDYLNYPTSLFRSSRLDREEQFYYADKTIQHHTPSYSIASDLHVELSEISSPPLTIDEDLSYQGDDISTYDDGDMENNTSFSGGEELWAGESKLSQVAENESRSREVNEVSQTNDTNLHGTLQTSVSSHISHENIVDEDVQQFTRNLASHPSPGNHSGKPTDSFEKQDRCHHMEQPVVGTMRSSKDSEARLEKISKNEKMGTLSTPVERSEHRELFECPPEVRFSQTNVASHRPLAEVTITRTTGSNSPIEVSIPTTNLVSDGPPIEVSIPRSTLGSNYPLVEVSIPQTTLGSDDRAEVHITQTTLGSRGPTVVCIPQTTHACDSSPAEVTITRDMLASNSPFTEVSIPPTTLGSDSPLAEVSIPRITPSSNNGPVDASIPHTTMGSDDPHVEISFPQTTVDSRSRFAEASIPRINMGSNGTPVEVSIPQTNLSSNSWPIEVNITQTTRSSHSPPVEVGITQTTMGSQYPPIDVSTLQTIGGSHGPLAEVRSPWTTLSSNGLSSEVSIHRTTMGSDGRPAEVSNPQTSLDANSSQGLPFMPNEDVEQVTNVQHSSMSPKSVLLPTFSVSSFDQYIDQDMSRTHSVQDLSSVATQNSTDLVDHSMAVPSSVDDLQIVQQEASSQHSRMSSSLEAENIEITNKLKILESHESPLNPRVGTTSTSLSINEDSISFTKRNDSNSSLSIHGKEPQNSSKKLLEDNSNGKERVSDDINGHDPDDKAKGVINESSSSGSIK